VDCLACGLRVVDTSRRSLLDYGISKVRMVDRDWGVVVCGRGYDYVDVRSLFMGEGLLVSKCYGR